MKKCLQITFSVILLFVCGLCFNGCSCSSGYEISVTFVESPEEVSVESYVKMVEFEGAHKIQFEIPEGYEEEFLKVTINGSEIEFSVDYLDKNNRVIDKTTMSEDLKNHLYSVKKKISFEVTDIKRRVEVKVDMSSLQKKTFDITLKDGALNNFQVITINHDYEGNLLTLGQDNTIKKSVFSDNKAQVTYGDHIVLVQTRKLDVKDYYSLYTGVGYFSNLDKVKTFNGSDYLEYAAAKRGNSYYTYNGDTSTKIFYFGEVKEDVEFLYSIPNYISDNKIHVGENFNTFYLLTNLQKYNSSLLKIETFIESNKSYDEYNSSIDKIDGKVVEKIEPTEDYYDKYDLHKLYLGDNLTIDPLLSEEDKVNLHDTIYIKIKSDELDISKIDVRLIPNEKSFTENYSILTCRSGYKGTGYFVKVSKEELIKYIDRYNFVDSAGTNFEYENGSAILYIGLRSYSDQYKGSSSFNYSIVTLMHTIASGGVGEFDKNLHVMPYILNSDGSKDYGYIDYEFGSPNVNALWYIRTDKLFGEDGKLLTNALYFDVYGEPYADYTSTKLKDVNIVWGSTGVNYLTRDGAIAVENPVEYNGITYCVYDPSAKQDMIVKDPLCQYTFEFKVSFIDVNRANYDIDFSKLELPQDYEECIYVTNNYNITSLDNFAKIHYVNKDVYEGINFGYNRELYYVIPSENLKNFKVEIYLDEDKVKLVSKDEILYDIAGNAVTVSKNGESFVVRYKYMAISYEVPNGNVYHMCND